MTDFRQVWCLHAYSGGTVRDSHPVFYSPAALLPHPQALKWNITLLIDYHCFLCLSIEIGPVVRPSFYEYPQKTKTKAKALVFVSGKGTTS